MTLTERAPKRAKMLRLGVSLDAFGGDFEAELIGRAGDRTYDRLCPLRSLELRHQRSIKCQSLHREIGKVGQTRAPRTEVIENEANAHGRELLQDTQGQGRVAHRRRLGNLEAQPVRRESARG